MIKGLFYIFLFYFTGEIVSKLVGGFIPGSVLGMILLFLALYFKLIHPDNVKSTATVITKNMSIFFIPAAVGLMAYGEVFSKSIWAIVFGIGISTILTIIVVAVVQEKIEIRQNKNHHE